MNTSRLGARRGIAAAAVALCTATACEPAPSAHATASEPPGRSDSPSSGTSAAQPTSASESHAEAGGSQNPDEELRTLDTRQPVQLPPAFVWAANRKMQAMLGAIQRIEAGVAAQDWAAIAEAAAVLEAPPQNPEMRDHLGAGAPGFQELATEFRARSAAIRSAANASDGIAVLRASSETLQACVACHESYRWEPVDAATWARLVAE